jgi:hypothetical protein
MQNVHLELGRELHVRGMDTLQAIPAPIIDQLLSGH